MRDGEPSDTFPLNPFSILLGLALKLYENIILIGPQLFLPAGCGMGWAVKLPFS